mgnify:CR=1 FL=1
MEVFERRLAEVFGVFIGLITVKSTCFLGDASLVGPLFVNEVSMFIYVPDVIFYFDT